VLGATAIIDKGFIIASPPFSRAHDSYPSPI